MTNLLARILLSILMLPLSVMAFVICFILAAAALHGHEDRAACAGIVGAAVFAVSYWILLWRRSVHWTRQRLSGTVFSSIACLVVATVVAFTISGLARFPDASFRFMFGGVFLVITWLPLTVLLWKETAQERSERIRRSAGEVLSCPRCGYNLTGLREARCPECGAMFTLNELYAAQVKQEIGDAVGGDG